LVQDISNDDTVDDLDCATDEMVLSIDGGDNQAQRRYFLIAVPFLRALMNQDQGFDNSISNSRPRLMMFELWLVFISKQCCISSLLSFSIVCYCQRFFADSLGIYILVLEAEGDWRGCLADQGTVLLGLRDGCKVI
jgi:hypothetical protein